MLDIKKKSSPCCCIKKIVISTCSVMKFNSCYIHIITCRVTDQQQRWEGTVRVKETSLIATLLKIQLFLTHKRELQVKSQILEQKIFFSYFRHCCCCCCYNQTHYIISIVRKFAFSYKNIFFRKQSISMQWWKENEKKSLVKWFWQKFGKPKERHTQCNKMPSY